MSVISENMKNMRIIRGYSLKDVADRLGCSPNSLSNWEKGKISPPVDYVAKLCEIYDINANQLLGWETHPDLKAFIDTKKEILVELEKLQGEKANIEKRIKYLTDLLNQRS